MRYKYTSLYTIEGGISPSEQDWEILADTRGGLRAVLSSDPTSYALELDRSLAVGTLLLRGIFGQEHTSHNFRQRVTDAMEELRAARQKDYARGPTLVMVGEGEMEVFDLAHEADAGDFVVCFDRFDKAKIRASFQSRISALISSIRIDTPKVTAVKKVADSVVGFGEDGRPVYSYTATLGSARAHVSRQMTHEQVSAIRNLYAALVEDDSLERVHRLLQSSLETNDDTLRSYLAAWWAFEIFIGSRSRLHRKLGIPKRFGELSAKLSPQSANEDMTAVSALTTIRNDLLHGEPVDEETLPVERVRVLLSKYLRLSATAT